MPESEANATTPWLRPRGFHLQSDILRPRLKRATPHCRQRPSQRMAGPPPSLLTERLTSLHCERANRIRLTRQEFAGRRSEALHHLWFAEGPRPRTNLVALRSHAHRERLR